jgi:hypothetical protein
MNKPLVREFVWIIFIQLTAMSLAAAGPARLGTIKSDAAGKIRLKIAMVGGRLQRIVRRHMWLEEMLALLHEAA